MFYMFRWLGGGSPTLTMTWVTWPLVCTDQAASSSTLVTQVWPFIHDHVTIWPFHPPPPGHVVVPVVSATRVCRKGRWDGQGGACVRKTPRFQPRGSCPPPPLINNGYYLSGQDFISDPKRPISMLNKVVRLSWILLNALRHSSK